MAGRVLFQSEVPGFPRRQGKVRDIYDLGHELIIVASDRISAFDWVMPTPIPDKGRILTQLSLFWFQYLGVPHHLLTADIGHMPKPFADRAEELAGRTMLVKKTRVVPIECVARGYLAGSGWKEYQTHRSVCGIPLPAGLFQGSPLPEPLFTPATKAETGHDENISFEKMSQQIGSPLADKLRETTLALYQKAADYARTHGIVLADTKFEFGIPENSSDPNKTMDPILIDEVLTPDSSRYWPLASYRVGCSPVSFDKQFLRDWLDTTPWDKNSPPPALPVEIVHKTREKYIEAFEKITGRKWDEVMTTFCR